MKQLLVIFITLAITVQLLWFAEVKKLLSGGVAGSPKPAASASSVPSFTDPVTGMEFVPVPGGCFQMGDTYGDGRGDEKPVHEVCLDGFSMGKYEVTNGQYRRFRPGHNSGAYEDNLLNKDSQPVVNVSWHDAREYAEWLSEKSGHVFRLPSDAEWEYAARGGTTGRNYWGDSALEACRYANGADQAAKRQWPEWTVHPCDDGHRVTSPVGSLKPNAFGLYDMMGNAWEWVSDWYGEKYYESSPGNNPPGPVSGLLRANRGGCHCECKKLWSAALPVP